VLDQWLTDVPGQLGFMRRVVIDTDEDTDEIVRLKTKALESKGDGPCE
jgi:hypothetical protein